MSMRIVESNLTSDEIRSIPHFESTPTQVIKERLIGVSRWVTEARTAIAAHAAHDSPVVIEGQVGTGKEFVARLIHECSARRHGPFITFCCDSISEESIEAALFGWIRLLPSGSNRTQRGLVEAARGGTLYVSGVANLTSSLRVQLARLIQHQEFRRLGDQRLEVADVRVLLGSAPSPSAERKDSWVLDTAAIGVGEILSIPPLRRRKADIEPLSRHFIKETCRQWGKELREITPETVTLLRRYEWPGNIGELKKVIEAMVHRSGPPAIDPSLLPASLAQLTTTEREALPGTGISLNEEVERFERALLCAALKQCGGVQARAARLLGLKLTTLNTKIIRYGIDVRVFK